jgi:DNA-directed RNA polymerase sigma subunit (sigma70/sigma32)
VYDKKILNNLEKIFDTLEDLKTPLEYEKANLILERKRIKQYLDKLFNDMEAVYETELYSLTNKEPLINVMKLYLIRKDIPIIKDEKVPLSDLSFSLKNYKRKISMHVSYTDDEIETLLKDRTRKNRECIMNSLLDFVFSTVLSSANDTSIFEELLADANETLLASIYRYDESRHNNFKEYLSYNLDITINKKQNEYMTKTIQYRKPNLIVGKYDEKIIERTDTIRFLKEIMEEANLSSLEKKIVEYIYGLTDGEAHTYEEAAIEFRMNKLGATHVGLEAINKLKRTQKKRS